MEVTGILLITIVMAGAAVAYSIYHSKKINDIFHRTARKLNMDFSQEGRFKPVVSGHIGNIGVSIFRKQFSAGKTSVDTVGYKFSLRGPYAGAIDLKAEGILSTLEKKLGSTDIEVGSPWFDKVALVHGNNVHRVKALLHPRVRAIIVEMMKKSYSRKFTISYGVLETYQIIKNSLSVDTISHELKKLIRCAELLSREGSEADLLRDNYSAESDENVKITYIESLGAVSAGLSAEDPVIKDALSSRSNRMIFAAAKCIMEEGYDYIKNIFPGTDSSLQADILEWLCFRKAGEFVGFFDRYRDNLDTEVCRRLAEFYGIMNAENASGWLESELKSENKHPAEYRMELIRALGSCGSYGSIAVLNSVKSSKFSRAVDQAIAEIQERIGAGDSGWLSMQKTEGDEGALSIEKKDD